MDPIFEENLLRKRIAQTCPHCDRFAMLDSHRLGPGIALPLCEAYEAFGTEPFDLPAHFKGTTLTTAQRWGLLLRREDLDGPRSVKRFRNHTNEKTRMYQVTDKGADFVTAEIRVPSHVLLYDEKVYGYEGSKVSIHDVVSAEAYGSLFGEWN